MDAFNIMVVAGLSDKKLLSKIEPILENESVKNIFLIRREPLASTHPKLRCYSPPVWIRKSVALSEIWRFASVMLLLLLKRIRLIIGIHYIMHCIYAALGGLIFRIRYIFLIVENPKIYDKNKLFWFLSKRACHIGVRGKYSKEYLIKNGLQPESIFIPPNILDFSKIERKISKISYELISIGSLLPDKRFDILIRVVALLKKKLPDIRVLILGSGKLKDDLLRLTEELDLTKNIEFKGHQENIYDYINQSKFLIMTSGTEGLPMVLVEALACGVPCVVPDVGDIRDVAIHEYNSLVVERLNINEFTNAVLRLLSDKVLYAQLASNALKIQEERGYEYSPENLKKIWINVISKSIKPTATKR